MNTIQHVSIPNPCAASWDEMIPNEKGRHCKQCTKAVIDFSVMSDADVISHLSSNNNVCGRFDEMQLARINHNSFEPSCRISPKGILAAFSLLGMLQSENAKASVKVDEDQISANYNFLSTTGKLTITGQVTGGGDGQPLIGVSVTVKGSDHGTQTMENGSYSIQSVAAKDTIVFSYVGYQTLAVSASDLSKAPDVCLQLQVRVFDEVSVIRSTSQIKRCILGGAIVIRRKLPFYLRWWYWLKHHVHHIISAITPSFNE